MSHFTFTPANPEYPNSTGFIRSNDDLLSLDQSKIMDLYKKQGCLVFKDFNVDLATFEIFTNQFTDRFPHLPTYRNSIRDIISDDSVTKTVNKHLRAIPLHNEFTFMPSKLMPNVAWFFCESPGDTGQNATTVVDGEIFAERLLNESAYQDQLKRQLYSMKKRDKGWWSEYTGCNTEEEFNAWVSERGIEHNFSLKNGDLLMEKVEDVLVPSYYSKRPTFINRVLHEPFRPGDNILTYADGSPINRGEFDEWSAISRELTVSINWAKGDLAMVDNKRFLHGREDQAPQRKLLARFGFIDN